MPGKMKPAEDVGQIQRAAEMAVFKELDILGKYDISLTQDQITAVTDEAVRVAAVVDKKGVRKAIRGSILFVLAVENGDMAKAQEMLERLKPEPRKEALAAFDNIARRQNLTGKKAESAINLRISGNISTLGKRAQGEKGLAERAIAAAQDDAKRKGYASASDLLDNYITPVPPLEPIVKAKPRKRREERIESITFIGRSSKGDVEITVRAETPADLKRLLKAREAAMEKTDDPRRKKLNERTVKAIQKLIEMGNYQITARRGGKQIAVEGEEQLARTARILFRKRVSIGKIIRKKG